MPRQDSTAEQLASVVEGLKQRGSYILAAAVACLEDEPHALRSLTDSQMRTIITCAQHLRCYDAADVLAQYHAPLR